MSDTKADKYAITPLETDKQNIPQKQSSKKGICAFSV